MNALHTYFYMSRKRMNKKGECPIYCRIALSHTIRHDFSTGIFLSPHEWDAQRGKPIANTKEASLRLGEIERHVYKAVNTCEQKGVYVPVEVVREYKNASQKNVYTIESILAELAQEERMGAESKNKLLIAARQFVNVAGNNIYSIMPENLRGAANEMDKTMSKATVVKKMEYVKRIFVYAFNRGYISRNPFAGFKLGAMPRLVHIQLTPQELSALELRHLPDGRLARVRDLFVFQCYTGLAFGDLCAFKPDMLSVRDGVTYLCGTRLKTGNGYMLPFHKKAAAIADKYNYALPVLTNQKYNAYLKEIADLCGIQKKLTTHVGRKTFSQRMIDEGYTAESVSYMMGHASFNMTQKHYGRIGELRIEKEVLKMAS